MAPGTIRNLVWQNRLEKDLHYVKPTSRKLLFVWSEMDIWLYGDKQLKKSRRISANKSLIHI